MKKPGYVRRYNVVAVHNHGKGLAVVGLLEGGGTTDQHIQDHTQAPDVDCRSVISISEEDFWCRVRKRTAAGEKSLPRVKLVGEPEVSELDHAQLFEEDHILWLQVAMDYVQLVTVLDGSDDLGIKGGIARK